MKSPRSPSARAKAKAPKALPKAKAKSTENKKDGRIPMPTVPMVLTKNRAPIPFATASIVSFKGETKPFLIKTISIEDGAAKYSLLGHSALKTEGQGSAWHKHSSLELMSEPTLASWQMLIEASDPEAAYADEDGSDEDDAVAASQDHHPANWCFVKHKTTQRGPKVVLSARRSVQNMVKVLSEGLLEGEPTSPSLDNVVKRLLESFGLLVQDLHAAEIVSDDGVSDILNVLNTGPSVVGVADDF